MNCSKVIWFLIAIFFISCNEGKNTNRMATVEESHPKSKPDGFQLTYFDSNFKEVQSKAGASYYREAYYLNGKPIVDSIAKDYFITGELQFVGHISSENPDVLYGQCTWYYKNGQIDTKHYVNSNGEIEGQSLSYFDNGAKKIICNYTNGKLDGHYVEYYLNGNKKVDYYFRNGLTNGMCKNYFENGKLQLSSNMIDGKQDGVGNEYYESGKLYATFHCVNGVLQGEAKEFYENGRLQSKGQYINGAKTGLWEYYDAKGLLSYKNHNQQTINPSYTARSRSNTPDDAESEGYDNGYEQGRYDASHGKSHGYGYDDGTSYYDYYETRYQEGYEEGYEKGFSEGQSEYEEDE